MPLADDRDRDKHESGQVRNSIRCDLMSSQGSEFRILILQVFSVVLCCSQFHSHDRER